MGMLPLFIKYETQKGKTEFQQSPTRNGMIISPALDSADETVITNCAFECGNARYLINLSLNDFGSVPDA